MPLLYDVARPIYRIGRIHGTLIGMLKEQETNKRATKASQNANALDAVGCGDLELLRSNAQEALAELPSQIIELGHVFHEAGFELALVGGPVRDAFLAVTPHDFDLTTNARPDDLSLIHI